MKEIILLKLGEMVLKGLNRSTFEHVLLKNIKRRMARIGKFEIRSAQSTVYIIPQDDTIDMDEAVEAVGKIFGVITFSRACECEKNMDSILKTAAEYLAPQLEMIQTFKV